MKINQKTISITLSVISMILIFMCTALPIFSFWNYRLCMIPFALVSILLFFTNLRERTKKVHILIACIILVLSVIAFILGSNMEGVVISAVLSVYIAILLLLPKTNQATLAITIISAIITIFIQISAICRWFNNYDLIYSGDFPEIPLDVADRMLITGFNEIGMAIIICCLICSAFSIQCNTTTKNKSIELNEEESGVNEQSKEDSMEIIHPNVIEKNRLPETIGINNDANQYIDENEKVSNQISGKTNDLSTEEDKSTKQNEEIAYCRKCGTQLLMDSEFCHKCGCEKVR